MDEVIQQAVWTICNKGGFLDIEEMESHKTDVDK